MHFPLEGILSQLAQTFADHADPVRAAGMSAYMRDQFTFYGLPKPVRTTLSKPCIQALLANKYVHPTQVIRLLWNQPEREFQYVCLDYLAKAQKQWTPDLLNEFERMIVTKSWWDTVDLIASGLVGAYFLRWPSAREAKVDAWSQSGNRWLIRTAILFQLKYRHQTDTELLFHVIDAHKTAKEFFIQKAIGWALRQYAYTNPQVVVDFVKRTSLAPLSRKEALKRISLSYDSA